MDCPRDIIDLTHTLAEEYIKKYQYPWQALAGLKDFILICGERLGADFLRIAPFVWAHKSAEIAATAHIGNAVIIGAETQIRHCAFIRGGAIIGNNCVVGNSTEIKNSVLCDGVQAPHFNYVGDSVLGYKAHLGAGAVTSNVKSDKSPITAHIYGSTLNTGLKKFGALVGNYVEIGCNCVLNPGTVIGEHSRVYPLSSVRGEVPPNSVYKSADEIVPLK